MYNSSIISFRDSGFGQEEKAFLVSADRKWKGWIGANGGVGMHGRMDGYGVIAGWSGDTSGRQ